MSYSTLMVHVDLDHSHEARLQMAGEFADLFDSRLIGVAAADIQPLHFMEGGVAVLKINEATFAQRMRSSQSVAVDI